MARRLKQGKEEFSAEIQQKVAARIKSIRKAKGYDNYEEFAYAHNFPRAQFGRYEKGQNLKLASLSRILWAFDMTYYEFFSEGFS